MRLCHAASLAAIALAVAAGPAAAQEPQRIAGALEDGDRSLVRPDEVVTEGVENAQRFRYDDHSLHLEAGKRYRISLNSEAFDPVARLYRAGDIDTAVAENDDSNESLNSRIVYTPQATGDFTLRATGFAAEARGAYAIEVAVLPPLTEPATLYQHMDATIWRTYDGAIGASDPESDGGKRYDDYSISFAAGQTRLIWLDSAAFDTLVQVYRVNDREGEPLASDDDSGGGLNSLLAFTAEVAGDYVIRVSNFAASGTGAYRLRVSER